MPISHGGLGAKMSLLLTVRAVCAETFGCEHYHAHINKFRKRHLSQKPAQKGLSYLNIDSSGGLDESDGHRPPSQNHSGVDCSFVIRSLQYQVAETSETPVPTLTKMTKVGT